MSDSIIEKSIFVRASRETLWSYLVDKDKLGEWYHPAECNLALGEDYALIEKGSKSGKPIIWGTVLEMNPPQLLAMTFNIAPFNGTETKVTFVLNEAAGGTHLSLTHDGVAQASGNAAMEMLHFLETGWDRHLEDIRLICIKR